MELESSNSIEGLGIESRRKIVLEYLKKLESVRKPFIIGYILRIIPLVDIAGYIMTGILWIKTTQLTKEKLFIATAIMLLLTSVLSIYQQFIQFSEIMPTLTYERRNLTQQQYIGELINLTDYSVRIYRLDYPLMNAFLTVTLVLETMAFLILYRRCSEVFKIRVPILFLILAIIVAVSIPVAFQVAAGLETFKKEKLEPYLHGKLLTREEITNIMLEYAFIQAPLSMIGILVFILKIVAYVIAVLAFRDVDKYLRELRVMYETSLPPPA